MDSVQQQIEALDCTCETMSSVDSIMVRCEEFDCTHCATYIYDTLDSPPAGVRDRERDVRILRPLLSQLVPVYISIMKDIGSNLPFPDEFDGDTIMNFCTAFKFIWDDLEEATALLTSNGMQAKLYREWLVNKFIIIAKNIYAIHNQHTIGPLLYKMKKIDLAMSKIETMVFFPIEEQPVDVRSLRIKIPKD